MSLGRGSLSEAIAQVCARGGGGLIGSHDFDLKNVEARSKSRNEMENCAACRRWKGGFSTASSRGNLSVQKDWTSWKTQGSQRRRWQRKRRPPSNTKGQSKDKGLEWMGRRKLRPRPEGREEELRLRNTRFP